MFNQCELNVFTVCTNVVFINPEAARVKHRKGEQAFFGGDALTTGVNINRLSAVVCGKAP